MSPNPTGAGARTLPHPLMGLLARYRAVAALAWRHRAELAGPARLADERAFLPAAMALQETPPHPAPRRAALALCALFVIALAWAWFGQVDIVAVAPGRIVVSEGTKIIQPLEAGVVRRILVQDGSRVQQGDLLVELDATAPQADTESLAQERRAAQSEALRAEALLAALASGRAPVLAAAPSGMAAGSKPALIAGGEQAGDAALLASEWLDLQARRERLQAEARRRRAELATAEQVVNKLQATLPMARQREEDFQALSRQGFVAGHAGQDRQRERVELERDLATAQARVAEVQAGLAETEQSERAWLAETVRSLRERSAQARLKRGQLDQEGHKARQREALTRLTAPVSGTVQQLAIRTTGGVVTPAQPLMVVVPHNAQVIAEVMLENKDIGFVGPGQVAAVKFETFPFTRYGTVEATVSQVSADAVADERRGAIFPVRLALRADGLNVEGRRISITAGMNLTAEIRTGSRRVIDYLWSPLNRYASESMLER